MPPSGVRVADLSGRLFHRLLVLHRMAENTAGGAPRYWCRCECGNEKAVMGQHLWSGAIRSCGCLRRESMRARGLARGPRGHQHADIDGKVWFRHPLYRVWAGMKRRCNLPSENSYRYYGGKGIRVCEEWSGDPMAFIRWAQAHGYEPGLTIDRIDADGHYEPANCRFITREENGARASNAMWLRRLRAKHAQGATETEPLQRWRTHDPKPEPPIRLF